MASAASRAFRISVPPPACNRASGKGTDTSRRRRPVAAPAVPGHRVGSRGVLDVGPAAHLGAELGSRHDRVHEPPALHRAGAGPAQGLGSGQTAVLASTPDGLRGPVVDDGIKVNGQVSVGFVFVSGMPAPAIGQPIDSTGLALIQAMFIACNARGS